MQRSKRCLRCLTVIGLVTFSVAFAQEPAINQFDLRSDADFRNYENVVTGYARQHRPNGENTFCVLGFRTDDNAKGAWIIWQEGDQIILWEGGGEIDSSRRKINLKSDVVPTEKDLHGSTYLVTQAWVKNIADSCDRSGLKVRVPKTLKSPQPRSRK
jgi:hypothetical protein